MDANILIIGAGPAGAMAAKLLADAGAEVLLIDAQKFPRKKPCGGWVSARAVRTWKFLGPLLRKAKAAHFSRLRFHSPDLAQSAAFAVRGHAGYIVLREKFDALLVQAARKAGARTVLGSRVVDLETGEREVAAILERGRRLAGRILIGADGAGGTVARASGLRPGWSPAQLVLTCSKTVRLTSRQRSACYGRGGEIHIAPAFGGAPGYAWAFPGTQHVSVGVGIRAGGANEAARLADLYETWIAGLKAKGLLPASAACENPDGGAVPAGAAIDMENHVGKRTLLVGDAGGFASAVSGEGIYPAMWSAAIAARCAASALAADRGQKMGTTCQDELLRFRHLWRSEMASYLQMPNVNMAFLLPLVYLNAEIAERFGRAFLFGENL